MFEKLMFVIFVIFLVFGIICVSIDAGPQYIVEKDTEERIYNKCISTMPLDSHDENMLEWVDRCGEIAKSLATVPAEE